jgi:hypothetical protein
VAEQTFPAPPGVDWKNKKKVTAISAHTGKSSTAEKINKGVFSGDT